MNLKSCLPTLTLFLFGYSPCGPMVRPRGLSNTSSASSVPDQDQVCGFPPWGPRRNVNSPLGTGEHVRLPGQSNPPGAERCWQVRNPNQDLMEKKQNAR